MVILPMNTLYSLSLCHIISFNSFGSSVLSFNSYNSLNVGSKVLLIVLVFFLFLPKCNLMYGLLVPPIPFGAKFFADTIWTSSIISFGLYSSLMCISPAMYWSASAPTNGYHCSCCFWSINVFTGTSTLPITSTFPAFSILQHVILATD